MMLSKNELHTLIDKGEAFFQEIISRPARGDFEVTIKIRISRDFFVAAQIPNGPFHSVGGEEPRESIDTQLQRAEQEIEARALMTPREDRE